MAEARTGAVLALHQGAVTELVLNRPDHLNAIDEEVGRHLRAALAMVEGDRNCRCLVLTGAGRGFCAGQALPGPDDPEQLPPDIGGLVRDRYNPLVLQIRHLQIPVVAAVNGPASGAGFALALAADLRVAAEDAWFSCGFSRIGLVPDTGSSFFLTRYLGLPRAIQLAMSGERISARAAAELGFVAEVFPRGSFVSDYRAFAQDLANGPTRAYALTKTALNASLTSTLEEQLEFEADSQQEASETHDFAEGLQAFHEKRRAAFTGK
ncbi:MAG TPA: enoyl-CoA hydratase-related protein [Candidatus Dormibacteraeota bacterium]